MLVGQRISQVPPYGLQNFLAGILAPLERICPRARPGLLSYQSFYHHYERPNAQLEAQDHLEFHRTYNTDIVKVMNDFDYPQSTTGKRYELKPLDSPLPDQGGILRLLRDGLNGDAYFHRHDLWSLYDGDDLFN